MNIKENLLSPANFILFIAMTLVFFSGCKKDDMCSETTWYQDADNDGLGNPDISTLGCDKPLGYVSNNSDTDDTPGPSDKRINAEINSVFIGETYPLKIFLPAGYETKNLPVLYMLDGKTYFEDLITWQYQIDFEAIIVGVGDYLFQENYDLLARDYRPGFSYNGTTGGHLNFYNFLTEEVVPYIDTNYENNHEARTLIGHFAAGLFTNFSLLNKAPEDQFFYGFLSINQEILNSNILTDMAENLSYTQNAKNIKLHISQVSSTMKAEWFNDLLLVQEFPWLDIDFYTFEDENTAAFNPAVVEPSVKKGLQFIYD